MGVPGLAVLLTPFVGETVFNLTGFTPPMDSAYAFGFAGQGGFFLIFFVGTCRLYRGTYPAALSSSLGLLVMAVWGALSAVGIHYGLDPASRPIFFGRMPGTLGAPGQIVGAVCSCLVISVAAHWPMVREGRLWPKKWPVQAGFLLAAAALACLPLLGARAAPLMSGQLALITFGCCLAQVVVIYAMIWAMRNSTFILALIVTGGTVAVLWIGPLVLEVIRISFFAPEARGDPAFPLLASLSPPVLLAQIFSVDPPVYVVGLVWQWVIAGLALGMMALAMKRRRARLAVAQERAWQSEVLAAAGGQLRPAAPQSASASSESAPGQA